MKKRVIFFLVALFLFIFSFQFDWTEMRKALFAEPLLEENLQSFDSLKILNSAGVSLIKINDKKEWILNEKWKADDRMVANLKNLLMETRIERKIVLKRRFDLQKYGLAVPKVMLTISKGNRTVTYTFGKRLPVGINYYAMSSAYPNKILVLNFTDIYQILESGLSQWQDRRLLYDAPIISSAEVLLNDYGEKFAVDFPKRNVRCVTRDVKKIQEVVYDRFMEAIGELRYSFEAKEEPSVLNLDFPIMTIEASDVKGKKIRTIVVSTSGEDLYCLIEEDGVLWRAMILESTSRNVLEVLDELCLGK